jgi:hypothetical protein
MRAMALEFFGELALVVGAGFAVFTLWKISAG